MRFLFQNRINRFLIGLSFILLLLSGCGRQPIQTGQNNNSDLGKAQWITDGRKWPVSDSLMYSDYPAPLFRKEFNVKDGIKSATLFITAAGYYSATINGKPVGRNYVDPAWTNYSKRIYYSEYDLTTDLRQGTNCIAATLGNGFYNPLPMRMWGKFNLRNALPVGKPVFIARLKIIYSNGETADIYTDNSWKFSYGPVLKNSVYLGEVYDGGKEISGWNSPGFDESGWEKSIQNEGTGGILQIAFFPPVQVTGKHDPVAVLSPATGTFILDMGVNFTGLYRIRLKGLKGDTIIFRFGERLYDDGSLDPMTSVAGQIKRTGARSTGAQEAEWHSNNGPGCPAVAWQTDKYIFGDKTDIWYTPMFTFHVFRYMEVSGLRYKPEISDAVGIAFNTNVNDSSSFTCSSGLINSIQEATRRTFLDNLIGVQSDCPGRERFGYGGDLNATGESFMYNFDMHSFYRKTVYDWVDAMQDSIFIDTAPFVGIKICGLSWESAFLITQYKLLLYYNDVELVKELYPLDLKWMEKVARLHPTGIVDKGLSDHESLVKVPVKLIGTTHYLECARIMKRFSDLMHDNTNSKKFEKLADDLSGKVLEMYWKKPVPDTINRQTLFSTLLYYDIIPANEKKAAVDSLLKAIKKAPSGHFTTGIFGTKYILETLSASGNSGLAFNIVNSTAFPGWGYMISRGATTIWETWKESDNVYSNCHPMFGSVTEWYYRWLAGIRPDPDFPGFKKFIISPSLPAGLSSVHCSYKSPFGIIKSDWEKSAKGVTFDITVPPSTSAKLIIPVTKNSIVKIGNLDNKKVTSRKAGINELEVTLEQGNYRITDLK